MPMALTMPGTETKVTPEMDAPTMPKATIYQGERLLARKKVALSECREVSLLNIRSKPKYASMVKMMSITRAKLRYLHGIALCAEPFVCCRKVFAGYADAVEWGLKCKEGCTVWASL